MHRAADRPLFASRYAIPSLDQTDEVFGTHRSGLSPDPGHATRISMPSESIRTAAIRQCEWRPRRPPSKPERSSFHRERLNEFKKEMLSFPLSKYDDQVDAYRRHSTVLSRQDLRSRDLAVIRSQQSLRSHSRGVAGRIQRN